MIGLTKGETLDINGGKWSTNDVIGTASAALEVRTILQRLC